jgi:RimJ/RimL family protein N-acetyltransferase
MKQLLDKNFTFERYGLYVRFVEESDAEFIVKLRTDPQLNQFLHITDNSIEKQKEWIREYKKRESEGTDYYFIFESSENEKWGVGRLYNIYDDIFTFGSWVFSSDAPMGISILGDIIVREIGFDTLGLNTCFFDVRKGNENVLKYHVTYIPIQINEDNLNFYFKIDKATFDKGKEKYLNILCKKHILS